MAKKEEPAQRKPWEESDDRKKALELISDEDERKAADEWDRTQGIKDRLKRARDDYDKTPEKKEKAGRGRFFAE
jgi:hypothetical protein